MTAAIVKLHSALRIEDLVNAIREDYPKAKEGILVVFDEDGMHTAWMNVGGEKLAYAAARLTHLAATE